MRVIHKSLRREFSKRGVCEYCGRKAKTDCAHIWSRGAGQVDIIENLVSLCRRCHRRSHDGHDPSRSALMVIVCQREGKPFSLRFEVANRIEDRVHRLRRMRKVKVWDVDKMGPAPE